MIVRRTWSIGRILAAILVVMALVSCVLLIAGYGVWTRAKAQDGGTEVVNVTETPAPPVETEAPASTEAPPAPDATEAPEVTEPAEASALAPGFDFKSLDGSQNVRNDHSFPTNLALRVTVLDGGDTGVGAAYFTHAQKHLTISRMICDDICTKVVFYPAGGDPVVLLDRETKTDLFEMIWIGGPDGVELSADEGLVLQSRGVELSGEQLMQNRYGVFLGDVPADSYLLVHYQDDETLQVNKGPTVSLTKDTDPLTVDLAGNRLESWTFTPEGYGE